MKGGILVSLNFHHIHLGFKVDSAYCVLRESGSQQEPCVSNWVPQPIAGNGMPDRMQIKLYGCGCLFRASGG